MPNLKTFKRTWIAASIAISATSWSLHASAETKAVKAIAWNIQVLGAAKLKKPDVMKVIVRAIKDYDLVVIQEVRDLTDETPKALLKQVNDATGSAYEILVSNRLGRTVSKVQYLYMYKKSVLKVVDSYHYADADDVFEREPFLARFTAPSASVKDFFVIPLQATPDAVKTSEEIAALRTVYNDAVKRWKIEDAVLLGDWSADCSYFSKERRKTNLLFNDPRFVGLIDDDVDTTTKDTDCSYDRVFVAGARMRAAVPRAEVFDFQSAYNLDTSLTTNVSDHYPVVFSIK